MRVHLPNMHACMWNVHIVHIKFAHIECAYTTNLYTLQLCTACNAFIIAYIYAIVQDTRTSTYTRNCVPNALHSVPIMSACARACTRRILRNLIHCHSVYNDSVHHIYINSTTSTTWVFPSTYTIRLHAYFPAQKIQRGQDMHTTAGSNFCAQARGY